MKIKVSRPHFPEGYMNNPRSILDWDYVNDRMKGSKNYWIGSVGPDQKPHVMPVWGVWLDNLFYFDGDAKTRRMKNIAANPNVTINLESGSQVLIIHGKCRSLSAAEAPVAAIAADYREKYGGMGYDPEPEQWNQDGLFVISPEKVIAWSEFSTDPTKFTIEED